MFNGGYSCIMFMLITIRHVVSLLGYFHFISLYLRWHGRDTAYYRQTNTIITGGIAYILKWIN